MATAIPKACLASSAIRCRDVETGPNLGVLAVFPSNGATCRCPLPSTGSRECCQVDAKLVDRPPRYCARVRREPAMLGIRNGCQPQLDNTVPTERQAILDVLHSERFVDQSPAEVYATLLEEQRYLGSVRTMYRVLAEAHEVRERRAQAQHPSYSKPELVATAPNQVWSWDITKLNGPVPYLYYALYVILDLFSRYVVGWMVAVNESAHLAERLIEQTCAKQGVPHPVPWTHICAMPPGVAHTPRAPRSACDTQASRDARSGCTAPRSRPRRRGRPRGSERFGRGSLAP